MDWGARGRLADVGVNCIDLMPYKHAGRKAKWMETVTMETVPTGVFSPQRIP